MLKRGFSYTAEYWCWKGIKQRCTNPRDGDYEKYGESGISMCLEWQASFKAFFAHVGPRPGYDFSLDRIDPSKGYEPGNVRWADKQTQAHNRRCTYKIPYEGRLIGSAEAARIVGIKHDTMRRRLQRYGPYDPRVFLSRFQLRSLTWTAVHASRRYRKNAQENQNPA